MRLSYALDTFMAEHCYDKGYTKSTVDNYRLAIGCFIRGVGDKELDRLTLEDIRAFRHYMDSSNRDRNGIVSYLYKLRCFLRWANKRYNLSFPIEDIAIPKRRKTLPNYLLPDEIDTLLAIADTRERAIVSLLYSTAMRVGELVQVRIKDVHGDTIKIRGKGDTERMVKVDIAAQHYLHAYLAGRTDSSPFLFYSFKGKGLGKSRIQKLLRDLGVKAELERPVTPHVFRHSTATDLLKSGMGLRYIQEYLGHADISTTQIYTHVTNGDLEERFEKYHKTLAIIS